MAVLITYSTVVTSDNITRILGLDGSNARIELNYFLITDNYCSVYHIINSISTMITVYKIEFNIKFH